MKKTATKSTLHPRNRHRQRYDFDALTVANPDLVPFVFTNKHEIESIDFSKPNAVKSLNRALLIYHYGLQYWDIPPNYLCPPIPGRADYIHYIADLLSTTTKGHLPKGKHVRILDIGVGANCIYPIIGQREYDWTFVGTDIDKKAIAAAQKNIDSNPFLAENISLRWQKHSEQIFEGIIQPNDSFAAVICNPPFYTSAAEAAQHTQRKWKNLGKEKSASNKRNFGGQPQELWCNGGEKAFVKRMIKESVKFASNCLWFTTLVAQKKNIPLYAQLLENIKAREMKVIEMAQGQKISRILAWRF